MTGKLNYAKNFTNIDQQTQARDDQVLNSAGGYVFAIDQWKQLRRFLILGSEGGTYYVNEKQHTRENSKTVLACIKSDINKTLDIIMDVSNKGLAAKNDPAIFAFALCVVNRPKQFKISADHLNRVIRTGTHFLTFVNYLNELCGWGSGVKKIAKYWYETKTVDQLAYQMVKYQNREDWTQRDALRTIHPKPKTTEFDILFEWICNKDAFKTEDKNVTGIALVDAYMLAHNPKTTVKKLVKLIEQYNLTHEMIPTQHKTSPVVWEVLSQKMPITAMIRNLGVMTANRTLTTDNLSLISRIEQNLTDIELLRKGRIHPMNVLFAMKTYASGAGFRGKLTWNPVQRICDALDEAFYLSFQAVDPTGKKIMIACDVSGSMSWQMANSNVTCCEAAGAMAMVTARTEKNYSVYGFCHQFKPLDISPKLRLDTVAKIMQKNNFGSTDASLPMLHALKTHADYDVFLVITDNETWSGKVHPFTALKNYRKAVNKNAKLIVMGMTATNFSIADPTDAGMLDVVGMDASVPVIINNFIKGEI